MKNKRRKFDENQCRRGPHLPLKAHSTIDSHTVYLCICVKLQWAIWKQIDLWYNYFNIILNFPPWLIWLISFVLHCFLLVAPLGYSFFYCLSKFKWLTPSIASPQCNCESARLSLCSSGALKGFRTLCSSSIRIYRNLLVFSSIYITLEPHISLLSG